MLCYRCIACLVGNREVQCLLRGTGCTCSVIQVVLTKLPATRVISANYIQLLTFCCQSCISVYLSQYLTKSMYKICSTTSFISCLYMFRAYVIIIRRSKLHYTASGIITPIGASTCFEHMCLSSGGQNCITQPLVSSHL